MTILVDTVGNIRVAHTTNAFAIDDFYDMCEGDTGEARGRLLMHVLRLCKFPDTYP